jgi:hypothetical protein
MWVRHNILLLATHVMPQRKRQFRNQAEEEDSATAGRRKRRTSEKKMAGKAPLVMGEDEDYVTTGMQQGPEKSGEGGDEDEQV